MHLPEKAGRSMSAEKYILVGAAIFNGSETQRMVDISCALQRLGYKIIFIGHGKYEALLDGNDFIREYMPEDEAWFTPERIRKMLNYGKYGSDYASYAEIDAVIQAELAIIEKYRPCFMLTGYRMSFTVSARIAGVPLGWCLSAVTSSIYMEKLRNGLEERHKRYRMLDLEAKKRLFFDKFAADISFSDRTDRVWNQYLKDHGCELLQKNLDIYTGDLNLMSDAGELFGEGYENDRFVFIGPIFNTRDLPIQPRAQKALASKDRRKILVSTGTVGRKEVLLTILETLRESDAEIFVSMLGVLCREDIEAYPANFHFQRAYPLHKVAGQCDACVIQGGQGTLYEVAAAGVPFLSICDLYEQIHNVTNLLQYGKAGKLLLITEGFEEKIPLYLQEILEEPEFKRQAERLAEVLAPYRQAENSATHRAADAIDAFVKRRETSA